MKLIIAHLYADIMNTYGDYGNIIILQQRCLWRGIEVEIKNISVGDKLSKDAADLYFFGGGQDSGQNQIADDLAKKAAILRQEAATGKPFLTICGGYQLLGEYYQPDKGAKIPGVGIFPAYTKASNKRMIGNLTIKGELGEFVGFENHSGQTFLNNPQTALGCVVQGYGNNGQDQTEGCKVGNAIGCYLHGSLLPKNPVLADWLISTALEVKYGQKVELQPLDDSFENQAHDAAYKRFSK